jgi:hypothetical protein
VTNLGRWGNGDVEVGLKSLEELPYVMGLVRQSYERQMGDGNPAVIANLGRRIRGGTNSNPRRPRGDPAGHGLSATLCTLFDRDAVAFVVSVAAGLAG